MLKVVFSSQAARQLQLLRTAAYRGCGVLSGFSVGRHFLLQWLLPLRVNRKEELEQQYPNLLAVEPECLGGVFFCGRKPFLSPWLAGEVVLVIGKRKIRAFSPEINGRSWLSRPLEIVIPAKDGYW